MRSGFFRVHNAPHVDGGHTEEPRLMALFSAARDTINALQPPRSTPVSVDSLELQLASAQQRLATLQRRASAESAESKLLPRALKEAENLLEELRVTQEQLVEARERLDEIQAELTKQYEKYWQLFDEMPDAYVVTKPDSSIVEANRAAAELFNVSQRFLIGKPLSVFVCENRSEFLKSLPALGQQSRPTDIPFRLRPRERAPLDVCATVRAETGSIRWVVRPVEARAAIARLDSSGV
jgi:two-component system, OmpR family, sensor histidine kinase VicK